MRNLRKFTEFLLAVVMAAGMLVEPESNVQAKKQMVHRVVVMQLRTLLHAYLIPPGNIYQI